MPVPDQLLAYLGLGGTPGIVPGAGQPPTPAPAQTPPQVQQGWYGKLANGLFGSGPGGTADPAAQNRAMIQMGLGMLAAGRQNQGLGMLNAYTGAQSTYQDAMQNAYANAERKRLEDKADTRYQEGIKREDQNTRSEREFKMKQWEAEQKAAMARAQLQAETQLKTSAASASDDRSRAEIAKAQLEREQQLEKQIAPLREKILQGTATQQEQVAYQLLVTGRLPSTGGLGFNFDPNAPGASGDNPLLNDPRL
jgi:hypothetical protein